MQSFSGTVVRGSQRAASLGYPTINLAITNLKEDGIFAATVTLDGNEYVAAAFLDSARGVVEAHILDVSADFYGKAVTITLVRKIRDSKQFENDLVLHAAIAADVVAVRKHFN